MNVSSINNINRGHAAFGKNKTEEKKDDTKTETAKKVEPVQQDTNKEQDTNKKDKPKKSE